MNTGAPVVAFDVTPTISGRTGIARYTSELADALERQGVQVRRFAVGRAAYPPPARSARLRVPARLLERWWPAPPAPSAERLVGGADVVHATGLIVPGTRRPLVLTVHDLAALRHPELHPARNVRQQRALLSRLGRATVVVTVSQSTADELARLGARAERVVVTPLGVTALPQAEQGAVQDTPARPYVLLVGETSPRKRHSVVVRAFAALKGDLDLVIVGPPGGEERLLQSLIAELGISARVRRLAWVGEAELSALYKAALLLCFPSVSEGFGLPVLEAMAAGLPVLASDIPTTRELAGNAAVYIDGEGAPVWTEAIETIASDEGLRARLAAAAASRAAQFTWERTAEATLEAYRLALATGR